MSSAAGTMGRLTLALIGYAIVAGVVAAPWTAARAIENARFTDQLGAFPVEVSLSHNGTSSLDTGLMGTVYWNRTGAGGFGAALRSTGPPEGGGTLSSYVAPRFLKVNAAFVDQPDEVARTYGAELRDQVVDSFVLAELVASAVGGFLLLALFRGRAPPVPRFLPADRARWTVRAGYVVAAVGVSCLVALSQFDRREGNAEAGARYPMPGHGELSFSSPQTLEIAEQVEPFIVKMSQRIEERAAAYGLAARTSAEALLPEQVSGLVPREGEVVVIAEADPQGSNVATNARRTLYALLVEVLGDEAVVLRTVEQLLEAGAAVPDMDVLPVGGLRVAGAPDPSSKALFGGSSTNESGTSAAEVGRELREVVEDELDTGESVVVVVHQPRMAAGYLGIDSTSDLAGVSGHQTVPVDDGVPDVPPGTVTIGHLHDADGPWVVWNTDGGEVTWTVVSQLGTSGGVEERPTFNRFSTPFSVPLKDVSMRLDYINPDTGLQVGYASVVIGTDGAVTVEDRVDVGLPGGLPGESLTVPQQGRDG